MSKNYIEILKSPEWIKKRCKIMKRDNFKCQSCGSKNKLQVHHKKYIKGKMPWEIQDKYLITLCENCHNKEHEGKHISEFKEKIKPNNKKPISKINKISNRIDKMYQSLSKSDLRLQQMYDSRK